MSSVGPVENLKSTGIAAGSIQISPAPNSISPMSPDLKPIENDAEVQVDAEPDEDIQKQIEAFPGIAIVHLRQSQEKEAFDRKSSYKLERKRVSAHVKIQQGRNVVASNTDVFHS